jgi:RNA polymerase sigma factor (sigma-70 family)
VIVKPDSDESIKTRASLLGRLPDWKDEKSWREFFDTYWKLIYSVALRAGLDDAAARDVVQETVLTVAKNIGSFEYNPENGSFKSWLLKTTRWRIMDDLRKRRRTPLSEPRDDTETEISVGGRISSTTDLNLEAVCEEEWKHHLLGAAIERVRKRLKPKQFQLFDCLVLKGWPIEEVQRITGVNAAQIYFARYRVQSEIQKEVRFLQCLEEKGTIPGK